MRKFQIQKRRLPYRTLEVPKGREHSAGVSALLARTFETYGLENGSSSEEYQQVMYG
jgi:hypothetical protein